MGPTLVPAGPVSRSSLISWRYYSSKNIDNIGNRQHHHGGDPLQQEGSINLATGEGVPRGSPRGQGSRGPQEPQSRGQQVRVFLLIVYRVEEDLKRSLTFQRSENTKLGQQISLIKQEKTMLQQNLLALQKRISELELQIGGE